MKNASILTIATGVLLATTNHMTNAQVINETGTTIFPSPDYATGRTFGQDIAVYGNQSIAVGVPSDTSRIGSVFVYDTVNGQVSREIWAPETTDIPSDFGMQIEISGDTLVVSTQPDTELFLNPGQVFVYDLATGNLLFELTPTNPLGEELSFGYDIAIEGDIIAVSQPDYDMLKGCVYLFDATDGSQIEVLFGSTYLPTESNPRFGHQVALNNGKIAVSHVDPLLSSLPKAFLFDATTRSLLHTILPHSETNADDLWGDAIAMNADTLIVCAPGDNPYGEDSGSVYAYDTSTGEFRTRLNLVNTIPAGASYTMKMDAEVNENGLVAVYSSGRDSNNDVSVDLFDSMTGTQVGTLETQNGNESRAFGKAIAFDSHIMYVSDTFSVASGNGRVYQFSTGATITMNPQSRVFSTPGNAIMLIAAPNGTGFRWFKDDVMIEDGPNFSGTTTEALNIIVGPETEGAYVCRVSSATLSDLCSEPAYLVYQGSGVSPCQPDFNNDGNLNFLDVSLFLQQYGNGCP